MSKSRRILSFLKSHKPNFSKLILAGAMLAFFSAAAFLMLVIWRMLGSDNVAIGTAISAFCSFVGIPVSTAIGFYAWKAKHENTLKIEQSNPEQDMAIMEDSHSYSDEM